MTNLELANGIILGDNKPVFIVAEIGLCHNGDQQTARELIKRCAAAGADAVKFQKRDVDNLAIRYLLDDSDNRFPSFGKTYREIRNHIEFDVEIYKDLKAYAESLGLVFFASVFDKLSADQMAEIGCPVIKIASHCLTNKPLIAYLCEIRLPVLLATGMAYLEEIDEAVDLLTRGDVPFGLYHCVSIYPYAIEKANLRVIETLRERYGVPVGYSSHETENTGESLAVALGAFSVEKHVTLNRNAEGFDHGFAQDMNGLADLVQNIRQTEKALGTREKTVTKEEWETRKKYHFSLVTTRSLNAGDVISSEMLTTKNPGTGIPARQIHEVVGKRTQVDIPEDKLISWEMLD